jgi:hypothetical protein
MLTLASALLACVPILVSVIRAITTGWVPVGDRAIIATRAYDVLTTHPPLLGQYSAASGAFTHQTHSLGPMLYWILAIPAHFFGAWASSVTMGLVNVLCVVGVAALARRRGGVPLLLAACLALVLMTASLPAEIYHDSWNPSAGVLPLTLLIFLCWAIACGEYKLLPLAVLIASFVAQCHLSFAPPAAALLLVAAAGLTARRQWRRRCVLISAGVAVVCWVAPVVEQVIHPPGNFVTVLRSIGNQGPTLGATAGWRAVERAVGIPPWWLVPRQSVGDRLYDLFHPASTLSALSTVIVLLALAGLAATGLRKHRDDVVAAAVSALMLSVALGSVASSTPSGHLLFLTVGYTLWWGSVAGMWAWLALGWGLATILPRERLAASPQRARGAAAAAMAALVIAVVLVSAAQRPDLNRSEYAPVRRLTAQLLARLSPGGMVALERSMQGFGTYDVETALLYQLRRRGREVVSADLAELLGPRYRAAGADPHLILRVAQQSAGAPTPSGVVASATIPADGLMTVQLRVGG